MLRPLDRESFLGAPQSAGMGSSAKHFLILLLKHDNTRRPEAPVPRSVVAVAPRRKTSIAIGRAQVRV